MRHCVARALGAILVLMWTLPAEARAAAPEIAWSPYQLKLQSGDEWAGELGTLEVPALRSGGASGTITLRFVRLKAKGKPDGPPIVYLAGGPGSSGIEAATGIRSKLFDRLRAHGDVILLDQRGTGLSDPPPKCSKAWSFPKNLAATEENTNQSLSAALRACDAEWRGEGVMLEAYNSADNAADVADLIRALGVPKARIVGISYGTFLGFALLRDHGDLVSQAVFAGTEGPDDTVKLPTQADPVLAGLSKRFETSGKDAGTLAATVKRVFDRLSRAPVTVKLEGGSEQVVSLYDAQIVTTFLMATSENAQRLPALFAAMDSGNFNPLAASINRLRKFYGAFPAMPFAMDGASPVSAAREAKVRALADKSIFGNAVNFPSLDIAAALKIPMLPARYCSPVHSSVPALFISGTLDSRTPPANAEEVRRGFDQSAHIIVDGGGHDNDLFLASPEILDRIDDFLAGRRVRDEVVPAIVTAG